MKIKSKRIWAAVALAATAVAADDSLQMDELVVVATPVIAGNRIDRFASQTTVITADQMHALNAQDLATALRRTPGVNVSRYNPIGSFGGAEGGGVFIRGLGSSRPGSEIKTFIDGVPMYMGLWNHPLLDLLSIDSAEAVEVFKSPQPQRFGNAFAAVNLRPKTLEEAGYRTSFESAAGNYNTIVGKLEHAGRTDSLDYYLGRSYRASDGHRDGADGRLQNCFANAGWRINETWETRLFFVHTDNYADDPGIKGADPLERDGRYATRATLGALRLERNHGGHSGSYSLYANEGRGEQLRRLDRPDAHWNFGYWGARAEEEWRWRPQGTLTLGVDHDETTGDGGPGGQGFDGETHRLSSARTALSRQWGADDDWHATLSAGARMYHHNRYGSESSPHAGIVLGYSQTRFHCGYSRGVLYPGLDAMVLAEYVNPALGSSWKKLDAETMDHYEAGISHSRSDWEADITLFRDKGRNRYVIIPPPPFPPVLDNVGGYRLQGVEATGALRPSAALALFAGMTWLDSNPSALPYAPETTAVAGFNWQFAHRFRLSMDIQHVSGAYTLSRPRRAGTAGTEKVGAYTLLNGKCAYELPLAKWDLAGEIFVAGENLTDTGYEFRKGYPMPGINGMVGIRIEL